MFENIGGTELLLVMFVVFLFFGPGKFPAIGKNIGKGVREFRRALRNVEEDSQPPVHDRPRSG